MPTFTPPSFKALIQSDIDKRPGPLTALPPLLPLPGWQGVEWEPRLPEEACFCFSPLYAYAKAIYQGALESSRRPYPSWSEEARQQRAFNVTKPYIKNIEVFWQTLNYLRKHRPALQQQAQINLEKWTDRAAFRQATDPSS